MKLSTDEIDRIKSEAKQNDDAPSLEEYIETMEEYQPEHDTCKICGCRHSDRVPCGVDDVSRGI